MLDAVVLGKAFAKAGRVGPVLGYGRQPLQHLESDPVRFVVEGLELLDVRVIVAEQVADTLGDVLDQNILVGVRDGLEKAELLLVAKVGHVG